MNPFVALLALLPVAAQEPADELAAMTAVVRGVLEEQVRAIHAGDEDALRNLLDSATLMDEIGDADVFDGMGAADRDAFTLGLEQGMVQSWMRWGELAEVPTDLLVRSVERLGEGRAVVAYRGRRFDGTTTYQRLWLIERDGSWRIYDSEDRDLGARLSHFLVALLAAGPVEDAVFAFARDLPALMAAQGELDLVRSHELLVQHDPDVLPDVLASLWWMAWGNVVAGEGDMSGAIGAADRVLELQPGATVAHYQRATFLLTAGRADDARSELARYVAVFGWDSDAAALEGDALLDLGRSGEARDAYRLGLADHPDSLENLVGLGRALAGGELAPFAAAFRARTDPVGSFEALVRELRDFGADDAALALVGVLRSLAPDDPNADYYEAAVHADRGEHELAAGLLRGALGRAPEGEVSAYQWAYLQACIALGTEREGYEQCPDTVAAFGTLAEAYIEYEDWAAFDDLLARHRERTPEDTNVHYYNGNALLGRGRAVAAEGELRRALELAADDWEREELVHSFVRCVAMQGEWVRAYETVEPRETAYQALVDYAFDVQEPELLLPLATRRAADTSDPAAPLLRACALVWSERVDAGLDLAVANLGAAPGDWRLLDAVEGLVVRTALAAERAPDARRVALASTLRDGDPYYLVLVEVALGRVAQAERALEACLAIGYDAEQFLWDEDLAEALEGPAYADFRRRHDF